MLSNAWKFLLRFLRTLNVWQINWKFYYQKHKFYIFQSQPIITTTKSNLPMSNFPNNRKPLTNFQLDFHLFYSFCFCVCWFHPVHRQSVSDSRCSIEIAFFLMCLFHTLKLMIASLCMGSEATTKKGWYEFPMDP